MTRKTSHAARALPLLLVIALGLVAGCAQRNERVSGSAPAPAAMGGIAGALPKAEGRSLRITVEATLAVPSLDAASGDLRRAVTEHGGYLGEVQRSPGSASFEAHVPVARLAEFRAALGKVGELTSESERSEDVTEQRADTKARLRNARAQEKRLLDLLSDRTGSLADVIAVEKELASVRETIERTEAQERLIDGQVENATVRLRLVLPAFGERAAGPRIASAFGDGIDAARAMTVGIAVAAATAGPSLLLLSAAILLVVLGVRSVQRALAARASKAG